MVLRRRIMWREKCPFSSLIDDPIVRTHAAFDVYSHLASHYRQKQNVSILFISVSTQWQEQESINGFFR